MDAEEEEEEEKEEEEEEKEEEEVYSCVSCLTVIHFKFKGEEDVKREEEEEKEEEEEIKKSQNKRFPAEFSSSSEELRGIPVCLHQRTQTKAGTKEKRKILHFHCQRGGGGGGWR